MNSRAKSGSGDAELYDFLRTLGARGCDITLRFTNGRPIQDLLADASGFDRVVAVGGDGTISATCYAMANTQVPILAYPGGTANILSNSLGLPNDPIRLADMVFHAPIADVDVGEIQYGLEGEQRIGFMNAAGAGFDAEVMRAALPLKSTLGSAAYILAAVTRLAPKVAEFEMVIDGQQVSSKGMAVLLVNFGRVTFDLPIPAGADPRDGQFEVVLLKGRNVAALLPVVLSSMRERVVQRGEPADSLEVYRARNVQVSAYPPMRMQSDGEVLDALTPFSATLLPQAASLLVGKMAEGEIAEPFDAAETTSDEASEISR